MLSLAWPGLCYAADDKIEMGYEWLGYGSWPRLLLARQTYSYIFIAPLTYTIYMIPS